MSEVVRDPVARMDGDGKHDTRSLKFFPKEVAPHAVPASTGTVFGFVGILRLDRKFVGVVQHATRPEIDRCSEAFTIDDRLRDVPRFCWPPPRLLRFAPLHNPRLLNPAGTKLSDSLRAMQVSKCDSIADAQHGRERKNTRHRPNDLHNQGNLSCLETL